MRVFFLFLFVAWMAVAPAAQAEEAAQAIGAVLSVEGTATVTPHGGGAVAATVDAKIHLGDTVATGAKSRLFILLDDNTQMTLSENSKLVIDVYVYDPENNAANKARYSLLEGAFRYVSGLVAKRKDPDVTIETPVGTIGIRGTDLWGGSLQGAFGVYVNEGAVSVANQAGKVQVAAGQGTSVRSRADAPEAAQKWAAAQLQLIQESVALKQRALVERRVAQIEREREKLLQEKQREAAAEAQQLMQQAQQRMKAQMEQAFREAQQRLEAEVKTAVQEMVQKKMQEMQAMQAGLEQQKQRVMAEQDPAAKQAAMAQMQELMQQAQQKQAAAQQEIETALSALVQQKQQALRAALQGRLAGLQKEAQEQLQQQVRRLSQEKQQAIQGELQQMLQRNQQELQGQLRQLQSQAEQQARQVLEQAQKAK